MKSLYATLDNIDISVSFFPTFSEFRSLSPFISVTCSPILASLPSMDPHSHLELTIPNFWPLATKPPSVPRKRIKTTSTQVVDMTYEEP